MRIVPMDEAGREMLAQYGLSEAALCGCRMEAYAADEALLRQGLPLDRLYLVVRGTARVCTQTADGKILTLCSDATGDIIGDVELMTGCAEATTSVFAASELLCAAIPLAENEAALKESVPFLNQIGKALAGKTL